MPVIVNVIAAGLAVLLLSFLAGLVYHRIASRREQRLHPPTGELIAIERGRLHVLSEGRGAPTVVLDSALAATSLSWSEIQPRLAEWTRVVSYDRAGFGWSDASPAPTDPRAASVGALKFGAKADRADADRSALALLVIAMDRRARAPSAARTGIAIVSKSASS